MHLHIRIARLAGVLALAALAACGDGPPQPSEPLPGSTFALARVDGKTLPVALFTENSVRHELVSETLSFGAAEVRRETVIRRTTLATGAQSEVHHTLDRPYQFIQGRLVIGSFEGCGPASTCGGVHAGRYGGDRIEIPGAYWIRGEQTDALYLRR